MTVERPPSLIESSASHMTRRGFLTVLAAISLTRLARAQLETVPLSLQAQLLAKVVKYDRNFRRRANGHVIVAIVADNSVAESKRASVALHNELTNLDDIGGLPFGIKEMQYSDEAALRRSVNAEHIAVLFLTTGLSHRVPAVAAAVSGLDVLTVCTVPDDVKLGIVLGFDLVSSQPKLLLNLVSAQRQNVSFEPQALKLMKVYR